jgi:ribosomal-protein-alanine N-acetyltransferase
VFRGYRVGDVEAMCALDAACFAEVFRFSQTAMRRFVEAKKAKVVVVEDAGELAGFCVVHMEGAVGYVVTIDVDERWRRKGVGGELMRRVEAEVREAGGVAMGLHVAVANRVAITFYEREEYERVGREEGFYGEGGDAELYRKELGGG